MCIYIYMCVCVHLHVYSIGVQPSSPLNIEEKARQPLWKIVMVGDVSSHYQKHYFEGAILNAGFPPPTAQLQLYIRVARSPPLHAPHSGTKTSRSYCKHCPSRSINKKYMRGHPMNHCKYTVCELSIYDSDPDLCCLLSMFPAGHVVWLVWDLIHIFWWPEA